MNQYEFQFGATALLSAALTGIVVVVARHRGWVFEPRADRWSRTPVAKFGGAAIFTTFLIGCSVFGLTGRFSSLIALTGIMALVGFVDDIWNLRPWLKFSAQLAIALAATHQGVLYPLFVSHWGNVAFTMFWLVAISNAFNLLDNMDGLSSGVAMIACLNLALFVNNPSDPLSALALLFAASLLGFLIFNFNPAKVFMGDMGSLGIGFFLGAVTVLSAQRISSTMAVVAVPAMMLFIPIFDMALVSVTRRLGGRAISAGAKDHSSHRLVLLGLSERNAVLVLYAISAASGLATFAWKTFWPELGPGLILIFLLLASLFWLYLAKLELPQDWVSRTNVFTLAFPQLLTSIARHAAMMLLDSLLLGLSVYFAFLLRFEAIPRSAVASILLMIALSIAIKIPILGLYSVYRQDWRTASLRNVYPLLKGIVAGTLFLIVALVYLVRFSEISRAALVLTVIFDVTFLVSARLAHRFFDDALMSGTEKQYVLVGGASAVFFARYFEWKQPTSRVISVVAPTMDLGAPQSVLGIPITPFADFDALLAKNAVTGVYLLPDAPDGVREFAIELCGKRNIPASVFHFSLENLPGELQTDQASNRGER